MLEIDKYYSKQKFILSLVISVISTKNDFSIILLFPLY